MSTVRILVTGSRSWTDLTTLATELTKAADHFKADKTIIVHGDCPTGADRIARDWADYNEPVVVHEPHPADWDRQGNAAGPMRNQRMVDLGAALCLAFPKGESRGTWDCIKRANRAGIPVRIVPERKR